MLRTGEIGIGLRSRGFSAFEGLHVGTIPSDHVELRLGNGVSSGRRQTTSRQNLRRFEVSFVTSSVQTKVAHACVSRSQAPR